MVVLLGLILAGLQRKKQFNKHHRIKLNNVFCHKIDAGLTSFSLGDIFFLPHMLWSLHQGQQINTEQSKH